MAKGRRGHNPSKGKGPLSSNSPTPKPNDRSKKQKTHHHQDDNDVMLESSAHGALHHDQPTLLNDQHAARVDPNLSNPGDYPLVSQHFDAFDPIANIDASTIESAPLTPTIEALLNGAEQLVRTGITNAFTGQDLHHVAQAGVGAGDNFFHHDTQNRNSAGAVQPHSYQQHPLQEQVAPYDNFRPSSSTANNGPAPENCGTSEVLRVLGPGFLLGLQKAKLLGEPKFKTYCAQLRSNIAAFHKSFFHEAASQTAQSSNAAALTKASAVVKTTHHRPLLRNNPNLSALNKGSATAVALGALYDPVARQPAVFDPSKETPSIDTHLLTSNGLSDHVAPTPGDIQNFLGYPAVDTRVEHLPKSAGSPAHGTILSQGGQASAAQPAQRFDADNIDPALLEATPLEDIHSVPLDDGLDNAAAGALDHAALQSSLTSSQLGGGNQAGRDDQQYDRHDITSSLGYTLQQPYEFSNDFEGQMCPPIGHAQALEAYPPLHQPSNTMQNNPLRQWKHPNYPSSSSQSFGAMGLQPYYGTYFNGTANDGQIQGVGSSSGGIPPTLDPTAVPGSSDQHQVTSNHTDEATNRARIQNKLKRKTLHGENNAYPQTANFAPMGNSAHVVNSTRPKSARIKSARLNSAAMLKSEPTPNSAPGLSSTSIPNIVPGPAPAAAVADAAAEPVDVKVVKHKVRTANSLWTVTLAGLPSAAQISTTAVPQDWVAKRVAHRTGQVDNLMIANIKHELQSGLKCKFRTQFETLSCIGEMQYATGERDTLAPKLFPQPVQVGNEIITTYITPLQLAMSKRADPTVLMKARYGPNCLNNLPYAADFLQAIDRRDKGTSTYHQDRFVAFDGHKVPLAHDKTSFHPGQAAWSCQNLDEIEGPEILYKTDIDDYKNHFKSWEKAPAIVNWHGQIVTVEGHALRDWEILPDKVGRNESWWVLEAQRRSDPRMSNEDFRSRFIRNDGGHIISRNNLQLQSGRSRRAWGMSEVLNGNSNCKVKPIGQLPQHKTANSTRGLTPGRIDPTLTRDAILPDGRRNYIKPTGRLRKSGFEPFGKENLPASGEIPPVEDVLDLLSEEHHMEQLILAC